MRRKDREMDENFAIGVVDKCQYAVLAMTLPDGSPYCLPLSIARMGRSIYFHCAMEGKKLDALKKESRVCITCVGEVNPVAEKFSTEYESAVVFGRAERVEQDAEKTEALRAICMRYASSNMGEFQNAVKNSLSRTDVWKISMDSITGKRKKYGADGKERKFGRTDL